MIGEGILKFLLVFLKPESEKRCLSQRPAKRIANGKSQISDMKSEILHLRF
jgi:hypothetical protein